jgi:hypothetical protein
MVGVNQRQRIRRRPREAWRDSIRGVHVATTQEGHELFDYQTRKQLGISSEEFLRRWDAGEYLRLEDPVEARKVQRLAMLIPFARRTRP